MLIEISCNKFREKAIRFHPGLNVVIGDDDASNSIGKSTLLMIIDFVFGGDTYIHKHSDAIRELGHHEFEFSFQFGDEKFRYVRSTSESNFVKVFRQKTDLFDLIPVDEYTLHLKKKYEIHIEDISFRDIVGRYARIWNKENLDNSQPLHYASGEVVKKQIISFIKLFNMFSMIKGNQQHLEKCMADKTAFQKAIARKLLPDIDGKLYKLNIKKISELSKDIDVLKKSIKADITDIQALLTKEILELGSQKSVLLRQKGVLENRIKRTRRNLLNKKDTNIANYLLLQEYIEGIRMEKIQEVDLFHNKIVAVLNDELIQAEKETVSELEFIEAEINRIEQEISNKLSIKSTSEYSIDRVIELSNKISALANENEQYDKKKQNMQDVKAAQQSLRKIKADVVSKICAEMSLEMQKINAGIYGVSRKSPVFDLREESYTFKSHDDTGTGTAYVNLITFDLAVFALTVLPVIVHDSPLFKNIENAAMENIIRIYDRYQKQIFIAIDEAPKYCKDVVGIMEAKAVLKLTKSKTLFIENWKNKT